MGNYNSTYTDLDAMSWYIVNNTKPYTPAWKKRALKHRPYARMLATLIAFSTLLYGLTLF